MFKKSSRARNIRRRIETTDDEPAEVEQEETVKKTITSTEKKKKTNKKTLNALSFEDEIGDVEEFQIKKSKASRKFKLKPTDELTEEMEVDKPISSYDADTLKKLREGTPSLPISVISTLQQDDSLLHEKFPATMNATIPGVGIPDAKQLRKGISIVESDDGFIPLDADADINDKAGSRLVREEDDFNDDGEAEFEQYVGDKLTFNKGSVKNQEKEHLEGVREMIEEAEDDDERSEDLERWEENMMRFGGAKSLPIEHDPFAAPTNYRPAQIPEESTLPSLSDVMKYLDLSTDEVAQSMQQYESNLADSLKTIENLNNTELDLTKEIERSSNRYNYFQELTQFVNDLGDFLDSKFPELEKIEADVHDILFTKTEVILERRWQNNLDDLCTFANVDISQLNKEEEEEEDEFGRVKELRNSETARNRRKSERQQRIKQQLEHISELEREDAIKEEGLWSDDEMSEEYLNQRETKLEYIQTTGVEEMMANVNEDFRTLRAVKDKFEAWKTEYYDDYQKAYGSLSLPGAFEFYIRTELVSWDPFSDSMELDSMQWHNILSEYGVSIEHDDPDVEMLNKVVQKVIIKKVKKMIDTLDAASSKQMRYASQILEQISYYVDINEKAYQELTMEVMKTLESQITRFVDIIGTAVLKTDLDAESIDTKHRFFWAHCKYLKTLKILRRQLPKERLTQLGNIIMDRILTPILKPELYSTDLHLQNEALLLLSHLQK
ncbi:nineteen complex-related protein 2-domain-containing protein [Cokeromyces recurvatus]|uniref:nineteen complex-related protein 2-domain-containing protein n=1 Tax=Cokeromyces recurvatus TaxID=90255 RepID=UPI00222004D3|nr:nineteen complex-related protein 2-domain-containing protein [Cokeromyces recurvatus]KAI7899797.1 nineteen complex-related protein 2-domain-containing protein [Cokeromyces recurvatus]